MSTMPKGSAKMIGSRSVNPATLSPSGRIKITATSTSNNTKSTPLIKTNSTKNLTYITAGKTTRAG